MTHRSQSKNIDQLRDRQFFNILTWTCASRHSGVQFFDTFKLLVGLASPHPPFFITSVLLVLRAGGHTYILDSTFSMHLANEFDARHCICIWTPLIFIRCTSLMSLMLGSSIRFIFPSPPFLSEFVAAAILLL